MAFVEAAAGFKPEPVCDTDLHCAVRGPGHDGCAPPAVVRVYLSPTEMKHLARLAYLEGVSPEVLASEWVSRELRWLMSIP